MFREVLLYKISFFHHLNHIFPPLQFQSLSILILFKVAAEMRQPVFSGNCTVNVNAVPQMENKIHWRKITSSTSIKEKNDGQKAGTWERIVLAVCSPVVIAPPHLQNPPSSSEMFMSRTRGTTVAGPSQTSP